MVYNPLSLNQGFAVVFSAGPDRIIMACKNAQDAESCAYGWLKKLSDVDHCRIIFFNSLDELKGLW